jgi:hypothetical protein
MASHIPYVKLNPSLLNYLAMKGNSARRSSPNTRLVILWTVMGVALALLLLRGMGLLTIVPGFIVMGMIALAWILALINGLIETR